MEGTEQATGGNSASAPSSFAEAFAADASPAPDPSSQATNASAAVQPTSAESSPQGTDDRSPFIPRSRFDEVVTARKAADDALAKWKGYDWIQQIPPDDFRQVVDRLARTKGDPIALLQELAQETASDPNYGPKLREMVLRQSGQQQQAGFQFPAPDVTDANGQPLTYSAELMQRTVLQAAEHIAREQLAKFEQQYGLKDIAAERKQAAEQHAADSFATGAMQELGALPGFADHKAAIGQWLQANPARDASGRFTDEPAAIMANTYRAYVAVSTAASQQREAQAGSRTLDDLQRKAAASTTVNPSATATASSPRIDKFSDSRLSWR